MRKVIFPLLAAALLMLVGCTTNKSDNAAEAAVENVPFEVAKNYFFKNGQTIPTSPKITAAEAFDRLFGMATFMGKDGQPTTIDFDKQFVLVIVFGVFISVICLTGAVLVFSNEINSAANRISKPDDAKLLTADELIEAVNQWNTDGLTFVALQMPADDHHVAEAQFAELGRNTLAVHPYTGEVLGQSGSAVQATTVSLIIATAAMLLFALFSGHIRQVGNAFRGKHPWWMWLGGICGATTVYGTAWLIPEIGVGLFAMTLLIGQLALSMLMEYHGWLGAPRKGITWMQILGILLMLGGVALIRL